MPDSSPRPATEARALRVCAVSYLNTAPLVYGWQQSPSDDLALEMALPSVCADRLRTGAADIGLVPVAEIARQRLAILGEVGIACDGPVRSILLFARKPWQEVRTLAGDVSSRTSVLLAQILLRERYQTEVVLQPHAPNIDDMLASHDAALVIGDPALHFDPAASPWPCLDLGAEWQRHTGLPMVFAAWAGPTSIRHRIAPECFRDSLDAGLANLEAIVRNEAPPRGISRELAMQYLQQHIRYHLGDREWRGMNEFLRRARSHGLLPAASGSPTGEAAPVGNAANLQPTVEK